MTNDHDIERYDDSYPTCERADAELRVYTGEMDPDLVSRRLGISPSRLLVKGQQITNSLGRERVVKLNGWFLSSEGTSASRDLRRHIDWLLSCDGHPAQRRLGGAARGPPTPESSKLDCLGRRASCCEQLCLRL